MGWQSVLSNREYCQVQVHIYGQASSSSAPLLPLPAFEQVIRSALTTHIGQIGAASTLWKVADYDEKTGCGVIAVRASRYDGRDSGDRMDELHLALAFVNDIRGLPGKVEIHGRSAYLNALIPKTERLPCLEACGIYA